MNRLLAPTQTVVDGIPLFRRVRELMKEKGSRYSISAVAVRLGISRETLRLMLNGEREFYWFELEKVADDLKIPIERILQEDVAALHAEIKARKNNLQQLDKAIELAHQRFAQAQGASEKASALLDIGYLLFFSDRFQEAEETLLTANHLIQSIVLLPADDRLIFSVLVNFSAVYIYSKQYPKARLALESLRKISMSSPQRESDYHHLYAMYKQALNELAEAKESLYKTIELLQGQEREETLGRALCDVAYIEYADLNYRAAKDMLRRSLQHLQSSSFRLMTIKDMVKVHIKLQEHREAERLIRQTLQGEEIKSNREMEARLLILLSRVQGVPYHAEAVAGNSKYPKNVRFLAGRFLRIFYRRWFMQGRSKCVKAVHKMPRRSFPYDKYF
ncbi:hypothetical protein EV586_101221 [Tumebacillus sp. BK434]|uniref:helix-turn-helix domain-containing protein n=1 Tax=Tumebacillus sp. BK434 TaxID=2512169 RepID=UPI00104372C7|nr:helix-turn-helix transcriptional regulator [Tumebacillus sp. BK434]TCP59022.1 hypothetical protein EV586_101221 [Tumebacillus sp. BK434]